MQTSKKFSCRGFRFLNFVFEIQDITHSRVRFRVLIPSETERLNWIYFDFRKHLHLNPTERRRAHPVSALVC